jgi:hypothetical protein
VLTIVEREILQVLQRDYDTWISPVWRMRL